MRATTASTEATALFGFEATTDVPAMLNAEIHLQPVRYQWYEAAVLDGEIVIVRELAC